MDNHGQTRIDLTSEYGNINELIVRARTRALSQGVRDRDIVIIISEPQRYALLEHLYRSPHGRSSADRIRGTDSFTYMGIAIEVLSYVRPIVDEWETLSTITGTGSRLTTQAMQDVGDSLIYGESMRWVDSVTSTGYSRGMQLNEEGLKNQLVEQDSDTLDRLVDFINNTIRDRVDAQRRQA